MKTITYLGQQFNVPDWTNYIAADYTGAVWAYTLEPKYNVDAKCYENNEADEQIRQVGYLVPRVPPIVKI